MLLSNRVSTKCSEAFKKLMISLTISLLTFKANFSEAYNSTASGWSFKEF